MNPANPSPLKMAVAGAGYIGQAHIHAIENTDGMTLTTLVDPSDAAAELAAKLGVKHCRSIVQMLDQDLPDAIVIATPSALHVEHAMRCIAAGLPVLLEKPVATSLEEAQALLGAVKQLDAKLLVGHHRAHSPIMQQAAKVVKSGQLGQIVSVIGSALFYKPANYFANAPWRMEKGAGPILLNMIHEVHNLRMICGEITQVQAMVSHAVRQFIVEDTAAINFSFANGALGTFMLSDTAASPKSWEQTSQENHAYPSYTQEDCYVIAGTHGSLSVPTMRLYSYPNDEERSWWKPFDVGTVGMVREDPIACQMAHFGQVIRGHVKPLVSIDDGVHNLAVTEAIVQAARTGKVVSIENR